MAAIAAATVIAARRGSGSPARQRSRRDFSPFRRTVADPAGQDTALRAGTGGDAARDGIRLADGGTTEQPERARSARLPDWLPDSPLGTYPSGGCDRVVLFYGRIAHMLWREFSGSHRGKAWAIGAVSALAFNVAYCRQYLSKHWFADIVFGLVYGLVLLGPFITAIRLIAGPPAVATAPDRPALVAAMAA
jgi:hypothetical protein